MATEQRTLRNWGISVPLESVPAVCSVQFSCISRKSGRGASGTPHAEVVIAVLFSLAAKLPLVRQSISPL